jgi:integrase
MRRGEALGLRWCDVDLDAAALSITRTLVTVGHVPMVFEPKTAAGRRSVHLDAATIARLRAHRRASLEVRAGLGLGHLSGEDPVFSDTNGVVLHPDRVSAELVRQARRWGFAHLPLHGLRHTWASVAMRQGVHPRVVQERLGHSNIAVTLDTYSHVAPVMHQQAAETVAALLAARALAW